VARQDAAIDALASAAPDLDWSLQRAGAARSALAVLTVRSHPVKEFSRMMEWLRQLDGLLRGQSTQPELLERGAFELALRRFVVMSVLLGAAYGFFMGWYALTTRETDGFKQLIASMVKLPTLFLLTLGVSFPSLYVFSALTGCRLSFKAVLRLLVATITVHLAIAASFGPILGFFTVSTDNYAFIVLLNVALLATGGFVSLAFLLKTLRGLSGGPVPSVEAIDEHTGEGGGEDEPDDQAASPQGLPGLRGHRVPIRRAPISPPREAGAPVFGVWIIIYGLVGAQMGWILRPFVGNPNLAFAWLRPRGGNFFESIWAQLSNLMGG
jgi:hypothetical protein